MTRFVTRAAVTARWAKAKKTTKKKKAGA